MMSFIIWVLFTYALTYTLLSWNKKLKDEEKKDLLAKSILAVILVSIVKYMMGA